MLRVCFAGGWWFYSCMFYRGGYSVRVERGEGGEEKMVVGDSGYWAEYLVKWPGYGERVWDLMQEFRLGEGRL
jgi:hypothetical protein